MGGSNISLSLMACVGRTMRSKDSIDVIAIRLLQGGEQDSQVPMYRGKVYLSANEPP